MNIKQKALHLIVAATLSGGLATHTMAASHSDAPLIKQDPQANITDVYAFVGERYDGSGEQVLNVIVNVRPFSEPGDGVIYERFADDALYSIHITNPVTGATDVRYDFRFSSVDRGYKNSDTILNYGLGTGLGAIQSVGDARQNYTQTYKVTRTMARYAHKAAGHPKVIGSKLLIAPPNVGGNTTPAYNDSNGRAVSGATEFAQLDPYTRQTVYGLESGEVVYAGPREDGFYADTPAIFDLLDTRILDNNGNLGDGLGQDGGGVDGFKGFNVLTYAIQIPISELSPAPYTAAFADLGDSPLPSVADAMGVGVYASVSRKKLNILSGNARSIGFGPWVQVNRMGNPLFNEVLVAVADKDRYNATSPKKDSARFGRYAENPEIATLINTVFGTSFVDTGRADLALVYLPDVIRVDTTTGPVTLAGETGFSRFGFAGGDTVVSGDGRVMSAGWPNGRRLGDDVIDIALTAVASGPGYSPVTVVGDNIDSNDQSYHLVFPYAATPHAGPTNLKDSQ
ncbi:MAG: DUF4331 domain-containing protein [Candidatus Thiodiazotropha sp.]